MPANIDMHLVALIAASVVAIGAFLIWSKGGGGSSAADGLLAQGLLHKQTNDFVQAQLKLEKALSEYESQPRSDFNKMVSCLIHLAEIYERNGKPKEAKEAFQRVLKHWKGLLAAGKLTTLDIDYAVSNMDFGRGTYDVAEFYIDNVVTSRERTLPRGHPDIVTSHLLGARLLRKAGYASEADLLEARSKTPDQSV